MTEPGVIDDLILYRMEPETFFVVVNASKIDEDFAWLSAHQPAGVTLENNSDEYVGLAVQGPECGEVFSRVIPGVELPPRNGISRISAEGTDLIVCRTGYTGEDGFEFFCPAKEGVKWFEAFLGAGAKPCGLGARDSLRLEMCYPLNGSDLSPDKTPLEAGLGFFCALDTDFIGSDILREQKPTVSASGWRLLNTPAREPLPAPLCRSRPRRRSHRRTYQRRALSFADEGYCPGLPACRPCQGRHGAGN